MWCRLDRGRTPQSLCYCEGLGLLQVITKSHFPVAKAYFVFFFPRGGKWHSDKPARGHRYPDLPREGTQQAMLPFTGCTLAHKTENGLPQETHWF